MAPEDRLNSKYVLYMDDFGTRTTCRGATNASSPAHELSFALGGVIVASEDVDALSKKVKAFCKKWEVPAFHGNKIRSRIGKFGFLKKDEGKKATYFSKLEQLVLDDRLIAQAIGIVTLRSTLLTSIGP